MSDPEYDPEFEAYLRRRVHLDRRLHSLARLEPPAELDRIIIGKARQAIRPSPSVPHFRAPKWAVPLGMAASLFMSFSLILDVGLRQATRHDALSAPLVLEMTNPATAVAPEEAPTAAAAPELEEPAALAGQSHFNSTRTARPKMALNRAAPMAQPHRAASGGVPGTVAPVAPVAPLPPALAVTSAAAAAPPTAASATDSYASSRDEAPEAARGGGGYEPAAIRLAANPPEMETVVVIASRWRRPVDSSAASAISVQSLSNFPADEARLQPPPIPDLPASLQGGGRSVRSAAANLAGSASPAAEAERRAHPDPEAWLDHIEKMQAVGLIGAAEQEMKLFRDAYPDYPVP